MPDDYDIVATLLENSGEELEISDVVSKLQNVEHRIKQQQQVELSPERAHVATRQDARPARRCWNCNETGHLSRNCCKPRKHELITQATVAV